MSTMKVGHVYRGSSRAEDKSAVYISTGPVGLEGSYRCLYWTKYTYDITGTWVDPDVSEMTEVKGSPVWHVYESVKRPFEGRYRYHMLVSADLKQTFIIAGCRCWHSIKDMRRYYEGKHWYSGWSNDAIYRKWCLDVADEFEAAYKKLLKKTVK